VREELDRQGTRSDIAIREQDRAQLDETQRR
jgi:hypothetical protein